MAEKNTALFEKAPVSEAVLKLVIPSVVGQIILVIYNMADTFFVSLTGSDAKLTAVTVCMPAFMFLSAIANLFGVGGSAVMSRFLGADDNDNAHRTSSYSLWGCLFIAACYVLLTLILINPFIDVLCGSNPEVHKEAITYMIFTVVIGGLPTALSNAFSHLVRAEGRSTHASVGIALGGIMNIVLDPIFMFVIFKPGNEVKGAAVATMLSNVIAFLYFMVLFIFLKKKKKTLISVNPQRINENKEIKKQVLANGAPAAIMTFCENLSYAVLDNLIAAGGVAMQAGIGVAKKINMLAHCIVRGMSQGVLPLIAYNYASRDRIRMKKVVRMSTTLSVIIATACMVLFLIFADPIIGVFLETGSESHAYGVKFLRILCIGAPFSAFAYAVISFFQAVGKSKYSRRLALIRKGVVDIPLMIILFFAVGVEAVVYATPAADILCCIASIIIFTWFIKKMNNSEPATIQQ